MKDPISIRITFADAYKKEAMLIVELLENCFENLQFQKERKGNNPKYKEGGKNYDPELGEFNLMYSRLAIKKGTPQAPTPTQIFKSFRTYALKYYVRLNLRKLWVNFSLN